MNDPPMRQMERGHTPALRARRRRPRASVRVQGGAPTNPDRYHNLGAHPRVTVEIGSEQYEAEATVVTGHERDRLYGRQTELFPGYAEYQEKTSRVIPVVVLRRQN